MTGRTGIAVEVEVGSVLANVLMVVISVSVGVSGNTLVVAVVRALEVLAEEAGPPVSKEGLERPMLATFGEAVLREV